MLPFSVILFGFHISPLRTSRFSAVVFSLFDGCVKLKSHDLSKGIFREFFASDFDMSDLFIGYCGLIILGYMGLKIGFFITDPVILKPLFIGINFRHDGIMYTSSFALSLVYDDIKNTGNCSQLVLDFLGIDVLSV